MPFDAFPGDQFVWARGVAFRCSLRRLLANAPRRAFEAAVRGRDFTVERGTLRTPAISSICNSSWEAQERALHDRSREFSAARTWTFSFRLLAENLVQRRGFPTRLRVAADDLVSGSVSVSRLWGFLERCQSMTRCRAMAKSQASNLDLPSYWWPPLENTESRSPGKRNPRRALLVSGGRRRGGSGTGGIDTCSIR